MFRDTYFSSVDSRLYSRKAERYKVNYEAKAEIILPKLAGIVKKNCRVADISTDGAGLVFMETIGLPLHFYLTIYGLGERMGCAEVNRVGGRVGVKFLIPIDDQKLKLALGETVRKLDPW